MKHHDHVPIEPWDVQAVSADANSSPTTGLLHVPELVESLTLLAQQVKLSNDLMALLTNRVQQMESQLNLLIEAMAEEQDPDDGPARYMDGTPV